MHAPALASSRKTSLRGKSGCDFLKLVLPCTVLGCLYCLYCLSEHCQYHTISPTHSHTSAAGAAIALATGQGKRLTDLVPDLCNHTVMHCLTASDLQMKIPAFNDIDDTPLDPLEYTR